jgi:hypothetical protein
MAAMMPGPGSGRNQSANPYERYDEPVVEDDDLIVPDDGIYPDAPCAPLLCACQLN